ncbi:MAG: DinB family protein [Acidobacteriota bacterium]
MRAFDLQETTQILETTPAVLRAWLSDLPEAWIKADEGGDSWSPFVIVGHLVHGEQTDWIPRMQRILEHGPSKPFEPYDRFAQFDASKGKSLAQLLDELERLRDENLETLRCQGLSAADLDRPGRHPELGDVTLRQLLAAWVVHDLGHIRQIARVLAKQYRDEIGPWTAYLPVASEQPGDSG